MDELKELKTILMELGIPVIHKGTETTPQYTIYHFNLASIVQLDSVEKKVKFISAYIHKDISFRKSNTAHFALALPSHDRSVIDFTNERFKSVLAKPTFDEMNIIVGVDDQNNTVSIDLRDMPHILIAGTTGSGKSVMVNNILCGLLKTQLNTEYYLIDTKRVELAPYKKSKQCSVATDVQEAIEILDDICNKIEYRYWEMEKRELRKKPDYMSNIVVVIEELNDLMLASKKVVEHYIVKIAQLGRACGVHLIVATQHPVVATLTGAIKANIGCRLALKTTSSTDSVNILGHKGAEQLKGKGDGLLKLPTEAEEIHLQCPFISDDTIQKVIQGENLWNQ